MRARDFRLASSVSADTKDVPSLGLGRLPDEALRRALEPLDGLVEELMDTVPDEFFWASR